MGDRGSTVGVPVPAEHPAATSLAHVRSACRDRHDRLEAAMGLHTELDATSYADALATLAEVIPDAESWLLRAAGGWRPESLAGALLDDLAGLGRRPGPSRWSPPSPSGAAVWGVAYVLEGSRLGARVIARSLATTTPDAPRSYFERAAASPERWSEFRRRFETAVRTDTDRDVAAAAAVGVFDALLAGRADRPEPAWSGAA